MGGIDVDGDAIVGVVQVPHPPRLTASAPAGSAFSRRDHVGANGRLWSSGDLPLTRAHDRGRRRAGPRPVVARLRLLVLRHPQRAGTPQVVQSSAAGQARVVAISLDGLNPRAIVRLGRARLPNLYRLFDEGAGTLNARTQVEQTVTLPNHTSMVTGRRIDAGRGGHGVTWNWHRAGTTVHRAAGHDVSSVFRVVRARAVDLDVLDEGEVLPVRAVLAAGHRPRSHPRGATSAA